MPVDVGRATDDAFLGGVGRQLPTCSIYVAYLIVLVVVTIAQISKIEKKLPFGTTGNRNL
jgi:hypothetical protein